MYGYPHKTAWGRLDPPIPLGEAWAGESGPRAVYVHVPFCEMRCGFCNLFTDARPPAERVEAYLSALERQARVVRAEIGGSDITLAAIGGGTPTLLEPSALHRVFDVMGSLSAAPLAGVPISVEVSPATATPDRLRVLQERGVTRVSLGVQSFVEAEARAALRPQSAPAVDRAIGDIRSGGFHLNLDLIYGLPGQDEGSWLASIEAALRHEPEEFYLYPLYVRPLTGLGRRSYAIDLDDRRLLDLYRVGRDRVKAAGYRQTSLRQFIKNDVQNNALRSFRCQYDATIGLGCGARSYTSKLHYSSEYAVGPMAIRGIIDAWIRRTDLEFARADHGFLLDDRERSRRFLILSLLSDEGLDLAGWGALGADPDAEDRLSILESEGLARREDGRVRLTEIGVAHSDRIGPWLVSGAVRERMRGYTPR